MHYCSAVKIFFNFFKQHKLKVSLLSSVISPYYDDKKQYFFQKNVETRLKNESFHTIIHENTQKQEFYL